VATQAREALNGTGAKPAADPVPLPELMAQLNAHLGTLTPYKLDLVDPAAILPTPENAHYMPKRVFDTLTENIKRDGNLASVPLCWRRADGRYELLSGNHRVEAAKVAKTPRILILYTDQALSAGQRIAMQLSHNALVGADNPTTLKDLFNRIDALDWKIYSGLDDALLATLDKTETARLNEKALRMEEMTLLFLPAEIEAIPLLLKRLGNANKTRLAARLDDFDAFFDALLTFKEARGIQNTGTALLAMTDIVREWLEKNAPEADPSDAKGAVNA
jgi:hypothetical protein